MALVLSELYIALLDAGASPEKARAAAAAMAGAQTPCATHEPPLAERHGEEMDAFRADVTRQMRWIRWMVGVQLFLTVLVLWIVRSR